MAVQEQHEHHTIRAIAATAGRSDDQQGDDGAAWWSVWRQHAGIIAAVVARTVSDPDLRPDALQEVWLQIWRMRHTFRHEARATTWAYQIARRRALNVVRHDRARRRHDSLQSAPWWVLATAPPESDPHFMEEFTTACRRLPPGQREVFLRFALLGQSHQQIAAAQHVTVGTARSQLNKARVKLKRWLAHHAPDDVHTVLQGDEAVHTMFE